MQDAGFSYRECEVVTARLENRPGTLAAASRRLFDAGVNVEYAAPTSIAADSATMAFGVSDAATARQALGVRRPEPARARAGHSEQSDHRADA